MFVKCTLPALYSSNNKRAICNTIKHTVGQDSETEILNTALNKKMTVTQHKLTITFER